MRSSGSSRAAAAVVIVLIAAAGAAHAARVDFSDPRRALGREDDIRIDAQLLQDTISPGSLLNVTYQIENLTADTIAVSDRIYDVTFDADSRTLTVSIGMEIPPNGMMPHLVTIGPRTKKTLSAGAFINLALPRIRSPFVAVPQAVQIKVNVLREIEPFRVLIEHQTDSTRGATLSNELFDAWIENNDTIFLNTLPIRWRAVPALSSPTAERRDGAF